MNEISFVLVLMLSSDGDYSTKKECSSCTWLYNEVGVGNFQFSKQTSDFPLF